MATPEESLSYELGKAVQELPPLYTRLLAGSISVLTLGTIAWAQLSQVEEVAVTQGKLLPSTEVRPIRSTSVGGVSKALVKEGDVVTKDQVLVELDPGRSKPALMAWRRKSPKSSKKLPALNRKVAVALSGQRRSRPSCWKHAN
ncbi:MAG: biotin/lipoyl-binding protein [Caldilineaceae bacterium]|nr:biotin/lipoyl-binding protein [Caldilineaceae bacterium]